MNKLWKQPKGIVITKDARDSVVKDNHLGWGLTIKDEGHNSTIIHRENIFKKIWNLLKRGIEDSW